MMVFHETVTLNSVRIYT